MDGDETEIAREPAKRKAARSVAAMSRNSGASRQFVLVDSARRKCADSFAVTVASIFRLPSPPLAPDVNFEQSDAARFWERLQAWARLARHEGHRLMVSWIRHELSEASRFFREGRGRLVDMAELAADKLALSMAT